MILSLLPHACPPPHCCSPSAPPSRCRRTRRRREPRACRSDNFAFAPAVLTVAAGTTVTWTNADDDPHTVTATGKTFHSTALDTGGKYSFTFTRPGEYAYFCSLHPHMIGKIIVKPS